MSYTRDMARAQKNLMKVVRDSGKRMFTLDPQKTFWACLNFSVALGAYVLLALYYTSKRVTKRY